MRQLVVRIAGLLALLLALTTTPLGVHAQPSSQACWGQASAVFAQMGEMGAHSSSQGEPRVGLRNLAVALYEDGVLAEPTLQALGAFVASALGLSIDACM
ncbi:MAG TPA: hypothetical protein PKD53_08135 [Chloroflexaceae bacterium]|nr:hypothetical protein [Chloroflexaceae bacterium]